MGRGRDEGVWELGRRGEEENIVSRGHATISHAACVIDRTSIEH